MIPHIKETVNKFRKKQCDVNSPMYYPKFTFKSFFVDSLTDFLKYSKTE